MLVAIQVKGKTEFITKHQLLHRQLLARAANGDTTGPNETWAMDFVHDQLATGRKIRMLTVVDTFSRYVPVLDPWFRYRGKDVVQTLERVCAKTGYPGTIRVVKGSEFISRDLDL